MSIPKVLTDFFSNENSYYTNHLCYEPLWQTKEYDKTESFINAEWITLSNFDTKVLYIVSHIFPFITTFHQPSGFCARLYTDIMKTYYIERNDKTFQCIKTILSAATFFGSVFSRENEYFKLIEILRSILEYTRNIMFEKSWEYKFQQQILHIMTEILNVGIILTNNRRSDLRLLSLGLQIGATVVDLLEQKALFGSKNISEDNKKNLYIQSGVHSILGLMRVSSFALEWQNSQNALIQKL